MRENGLKNDTGRNERGRNERGRNRRGGKKSRTISALRSLDTFLPLILSLLTLVVLGSLMALLHGVAPYDIGRLVWKHVLSTPYGLSQILFRATPLIFTGLAVAIAFQTGLFNIGAEGQAVVGSLALATVGCTFSGLPALLLWPLVLGAGLFMGGFWGWIPGWLKARWGTHEVINTIMLNFIALALSNYVISHHLAMPESVRTADVAPSLWLPRLSGLWPATQGSPVNLSFVIAVFLAIAIHFFLKSTRAGFALRAAGRGPRAALWAGVKVNRAIILSMALSGAMASLVGLNTVLGYKHYYEDGMTGGVGFIGIGVALLARNNPIAIIPSALFFGFLSFTGLAINHLVPKEAVDVLTGAILILAILAEAWRRKRNRAVRAFTKRSGETGGGGDK